MVDKPARSIASARERDRIADEREALADQREELANARDAEADERDRGAQRRDTISEQRSVVDERLDYSFGSEATDNARLHPADRADSARLREFSASDREMAAEDRQLDREENNLAHGEPESAASALREIAAQQRDTAADARDNLRDRRDDNSAESDDTFAQALDHAFERRPDERQHSADDRAESALNREQSAADRGEAAGDRAIAAQVRERERQLHRSTIATLTEDQRAALRESQRDALTGIPNRHQMNGRLAEDFARRTRGTPGPTLMFIDIDNFKRINDEFGHRTGDMVLQQVASRLNKAVKPQDLVARIGGDEFVVITNMAATSPATGELATSIRIAVAQPISLRSQATLAITVSIGIAAAVDCDDETQLLRNADVALHDAKNSGRNRCEWFGADPR
ncbi:MAG: diguanylate cyclase [Candidatus Nanopelagicales bacterium]